MICPLLAISVAGTNNQCKEEQCAWYYANQSKCALLTIADNLVYGSENLYDVVNAINRK